MRGNRSARFAAAGFALLLAGCADTPEPAQPSAIVGPVWVAEDIAGRGIIDNSRITLQLGADGRASGRGGCNGYGGGYSLAGESLRFGPLAATQMACAEALMNQERRYFDALAGTARYALADDGALLLTTVDGRQILFRQEDAAESLRAAYACDDGTRLDVTFDPQAGTAAVSVNGAAPLLLPQAPAGSGFLYETPRHSLRGKGTEAKWTVGRKVPVRCVAG
ncbi:MAG: META domain-containing protein [Dongiaceae bacterium]